jgi:oligogalacturonide transport system permease protein
MAIKSVPPELYEAAEIDGAGRIKKFFRITIPYITPVIFYNMVTQTGLAFQEFNAPFVITQGGPRGSTTLVSLLIYNIAFNEKNMGMACALTWVFSIIVSVIALLMFISQKYWVYYDGTLREEK